MTRCRKQTGFTLLELIVVIGLVATLVAVGLDRLRFYQEAAEAAAAESTLVTLKSALLIRSAELNAANRWSELRQLPRHNPFELLEEKPGNYGGYLGAANGPGQWFFDEAEGSVVYRVARSETFLAADGGSEMRFHLVGRGVAGDAGNKGSIAYVSLRARTEYRWLNRLIR